ncbi:unnamed protein product [Dibothriocephalus latus]|uniref:Uncharacterized protein n=1 Tax=Dibothriocephalus latus TaxID=60516 RepID=A0A3P6RQL0_DIBLA|nr:unnamed protein product [Dibothriocephalus latus]
MAVSWTFCGARQWALMGWENPSLPWRPQQAKASQKSCPSWLNVPASLHPRTMSTTWSPSTVLQNCLVERSVNERTLSSRWPTRNSGER